MADSAGATSVSSASNDVAAPPPSGDVQNSDARQQNSSKGGSSKQSLEQFAKQAAKNPQAKPQNPNQQQAPAEDDPEFDFDGEKYTKSQLADMAKRRREYDRASSQRMEEAAKIRKEVEAERAEFREMMQQFKQDPWRLVEHAGLNADELAEQRLAKTLQRQQMSPEAIELEKARAELAKIQQEKAQIEEQTKRTAHEQRVSHWKAWFDKAIGSALESGSLPRTARTAQRMRQALEDLVDAGHQMDDTAISMAADMARESATGETQGLLGDLAKHNPRALVEMLGGLDGEIVKAIQRLAVERHESATRPKPAQQAAPKPQPKPKGPPTLEEVRKQLGIS